VARYDRAIPPGGEGTITLKLDPRACFGGAKKLTVVTCNDPRTPYFILILKGRGSI
jgi:hypothetical protein